MSVENILVSIEESVSYVELEKRLQKAIENIGFSEFCFVDLSRPHETEPFHAGTINMDWVNDYVNNDFVSVDPCVSLARRRNTPFRWAEACWLKSMGKRKNRSQRLLEAAQDHHFNDGYVVPFHFVDLQSRRYSAVAGLFWKQSVPELNRMLSPLQRTEIDLIMLYWIQRAIELKSQEFMHEVTWQPDATGRRSETQLLTDRERNVLEWAARGRTSGEIGEILQISDQTVNGYAKSAIDKLNALNRVHAAAKAIKLGLIDV